MVGSRIPRAQIPLLHSQSQPHMYLGGPETYMLMKNNGGWIELNKWIETSEAARRPACGEPVLRLDIGLDGDSIRTMVNGEGKSSAGSVSVCG